MYAELNNIDVLILCGGKGKRLRKVLGNRPKPLVHIGKRVFLDIIIDYLAEFGFRRFILGIGYKAKMIEGYYKNRTTNSLEIIFSREITPLDTGGAVKKAKHLIKGSRFLVLNGDSFVKFNPGVFLKFHKKNSAIASILLKKMPGGNDYGAIAMDKNQRITEFCEKHSLRKRALVSAGVYFFERKIFQQMPLRSRFSLEYDFFPTLTSQKLFGFVTRGFFIDIGTPRRLNEARKYFIRKGLK